MRSSTSFYPCPARLSRQQNRSARKSFATHTTATIGVRMLEYDAKHRVKETAALGFCPSQPPWPMNGIDTNRDSATFFVRNPAHDNNPPVAPYCDRSNPLFRLLIGKLPDRRRRQ